IARRQSPTLFPYTTLFRSESPAKPRARGRDRRNGRRDGPPDGLAANCDRRNGSAGARRPARALLRASSVAAERAVFRSSPYDPREPVAPLDRTLFISRTALSLWLANFSIYRPGRRRERCAWSWSLR